MKHARNKIRISSLGAEKAFEIRVPSRGAKMDAMVPQGAPGSPRVPKWKRVYGTTNAIYGTTNADAGVGIGMKRGDSKI